ncbi:MAG: branched-chain amino acid ABC transporter permease [Actinomycetia bacterium]|nr:branched-chain amino acid ABC transporter permease [Actinomycetes bacterium]
MTSLQSPDRGRAVLPKPPRRIPWGFVLLGGVLILLPFVLDNIDLRRNAQLIVLSIGVLGVGVATGYAGLISLGHGAFVGIGAFAMATYVDNLGLPFLVALPLVFITGVLFGCVLGLPALRIKGIYLALVTLGFALVFPPLAKRFPSLTGGVSGRAVDAEFNPPAWTGLDENQTVLWRYGFCVLVCILLFWLTHNMINSRVGRSLQAVRDNETAAAVFGVDLVVAKVGAFGFSAGLAAMAGALQTILFPFVSHEQFDVFLSFRLYAAAVLGGLGTLVGAVYGVIALILVPRINDALNLLENEVFVFGAGLILLTFVSPDGLAGLIHRRGRRHARQE